MNIFYDFSPFTRSMHFFKFPRTSPIILFYLALMEVINYFLSTFSRFDFYTKLQIILISKQNSMIEILSEAFNKLLKI